jgi:hypothetical protein
MTHDISHLHWIVENDEIRLDPNDAISIRLWVTKLQQCGAHAVLKDKLDPPPVGSGLSNDTFVLCLQTEFQRDRFCYGRLAVVSDVDDGGFALNVDKELRGSAVL